MNTQSNSLKYSCTKTAANGVQFKIDIRLDDQCKNGHQDFAITGESWEAGKPKIERYSLGMGAIGDEIAKHFPEFKIFNDLHLCDRTGTPMHALENGFYHLKNKETAMNYLRISAPEYDTLCHAGNTMHLALMLNDLGIPQRWQNEANEAIKQLEKLTGLRFEVNSTKSHLNVTPEQLAETRAQAETGYFEPEQVEARAQAKKAAAIADKRAKIIANANEAIANANTDMAIRLAILDAGFLQTNFIYYTHTNTLSFNWQESTYAGSFTEAAQGLIMDALTPSFPTMLFEDKKHKK